MSALLEVEGLNVLFGGGRPSWPVRDVSLSVEAGQTLCIVGESGSGKSMTGLATMRLLPKAARGQSAACRLDGLELGALSEREMEDVRGKQISMIFQEPMTSLNPSHTIGRQLTEAYLRHLGGTRSNAWDRALLLLEKVGLSAAGMRLRQYPHQLSGGSRQRVMIAMALMCGPKLVIADEPTTALDVTIQAQILRLLKSLQSEFGMGLMFITHDLGVVARVADKVAVMYAGQIVETGAVEEVFASPKHPYTAALLNCIPVPGKTLRGQHLPTIPGVVPALGGDLGGCHFRERCSYAAPECSGNPIALQAVAASQQVRCVRSGQIMSSPSSMMTQ